MRSDHFVTALQALMKDHGILYISGESDMIKIVAPDPVEVIGSFMRIHQEPSKTF